MSNGCSLDRRFPFSENHQKASPQALQVYAAAADQIDLLVCHVRILARSALGVVRTGDRAPEPLAVAVRDLARATEALAVYLEAPGGPEEARWLALKAAEGAAALLREREDLANDMATNSPFRLPEPKPSVKAQKRVREIQARTLKAPEGQKE